MKKIYLAIAISFVTLMSVGNAQASVSVDLGNFTGVNYNSGHPTPTYVTTTFTIVNDESSPLTISSLKIDSTSMGFYQVEAGNDWTCSYVETHPAPNFERTATCVPNNTLVINSGDNTDVALRFMFEDTSATPNSHPDSIELNNIILNGNTQNPLSVNLGGSDWKITAEDDAEDDADLAIVEGYIYFDDNDNGKKDKNEQGVEDIKIKLYYAGPDDKFDTNDDEKYKDKTNEKGKYKFDDLNPGRYRLKIEDGQMVEFYLTAEKDAINGKSHFKLAEGETKKRDFGYDRDRDSKGNVKNNELTYLKSGFTLSMANVINYLINLAK